MITEIESKIKQLNGGQFQKLVQCYVSAEYGKVSSPGAQQGTNKTAAGTPDSYITDESDEYIFIEYTTENGNVYNKINDDINKCFKVSEEESINISKILYFHTSHPLSASNDLKLKEKCKCKNCILEIYDISMLSLELYHKHTNILHDILGMAIDSGLIVRLDDFIKRNDLQKASMPLGVDIIGREDVLKEVNHKIEGNDVVIFIGCAGIGKTRIAIEACREFSNSNPLYEIYCIQKNDLKLYDEFKRYFEKDKDFLVFVDDVNQITSFKYLLDYIGSRSKHSFKIIATVRDYAKSNVIHEIVEKENINLDLIQIEQLPDDAIREIAKKNFNINNSVYIERIVEIAKGNARLASYASKISVESNTIMSIYDATQLIEKYYEKIIKENAIDTNDLIIIACTYMLDGIYFEDADTMQELSNITGFTQEEFKSKALDLHRRELIDFCEGAAIKPAEQILSCYLAYSALYKEKCVLISDILSSFFIPRVSIIIRGLVGISNYFKNEGINEYLEQQVNIAWDKVRNDPSKNLTYLTSFHMLNPDKTLLQIHESIKQTQFIQYQGDYIYEKNSSNNIPDILQMLSGYSNTEYWKTAIDLIFLYAEKRQDKFNDIVFAFTSCHGFGIMENTHTRKYVQQQYIIDKVIGKSQKWQDVFFTNVFLELAKHYLRISYEVTRSTDKRAFIISDIGLLLSDESKSFREIIWLSLIELFENNKYKNKLNYVIKSYSLQYRLNKGDKQNEFAAFDSTYIFDLSDKIDFDIFKDVFTYYKLLKKISRYGISIVDKTKLCLENEVFELYYFLLGEKFDEFDYIEKEERTKKNVISKTANYNTNEYLRIIDLREKINFNQNEYGTIIYHINSSMFLIISRAFENESIEHWKILQKILSVVNPTNYTCEIIIYEALQAIDLDKVESLILSSAQGEKLFLITDYFRALERKLLIKERHIDLLKKYYDLELCGDNNYWLDFECLKYFYKFDKNIYIDILSLIMQWENENNKNRINMFSIFGRIDNPEEIVHYFKNDLKVLKDLYLKMLLLKRDDDHSNKYFKCFVEKNIIDLYDYISLAMEKGDYTINHNIADKLSSLWEINDCGNYINQVIDFLIQDEADAALKFKKKSILASLFKIEKGEDNDSTVRMDKWISEFIQSNYANSIKITRIFDIICELSRDKRLKFIEEFLAMNYDFQLFDSLRLFPSSFSWSGSELPLIDKDIEYLNDILKLMDGIDFIEHRKYISDKIEYKKESRKKVRIKEFLRDY